MLEEQKLGNQFCFPIYTLAKEVVAVYRPILEELDLTYPQYLVMMLLWEKKELTVSQIGEHLSLDNSTVTPILKRLEQKNLVEKTRSREDERIVYIRPGKAGIALEAAAAQVPQRIFESLQVSVDDLIELKEVITRILSKLKK